MPGTLFRNPRGPGWQLGLRLDVWAAGPAPAAGPGAPPPAPGPGARPRAALLGPLLAVRAAAAEPTGREGGGGGDTGDGPGGGARSEAAELRAADRLPRAAGGGVGDPAGRRAAGARRGLERALESEVSLVVTACMRPQDIRNFGGEVAPGSLLPAAVLGGGAEEPGEGEGGWLGLVGFARGSSDRSIVATVDEVCVTRSLRRRGIGRAVAERLVEEFGARYGIQDIATVVEGAESPALAQFFARCFFGDDPFQSVPMRARP